MASSINSYSSSSESMWVDSGAFYDITRDYFGLSLSLMALLAIAPFLWSMVLMVELAKTEVGL